MRFLFIIVISLLSFSSQAFEGTFVAKYKQFNESGDKFDFHWTFKGNKCALKMEYTSKDIKSSTVFIPEVANKRFLTYMPSSADKLYYEIPLSSVIGDTPKFQMQETNETKKISGIECKKFVFTLEGQNCEVWIALSVDIDWNPFAAFFKTAVDIQAMAANGIKGLPMEMILKDERGIITQSYTVTSFNPQKVSDEMLAVPSGYQFKSTTE
jgi:hypothetical protein